MHLMQKTLAARLFFTCRSPSFDRNLDINKGETVWPKWNWAWIFRALARRSKIGARGHQPDCIPCPKKNIPTAYEHDKKKKKRDRPEIEKLKVPLVAAEKVHKIVFVVFTLKTSPSLYLVRPSASTNWNTHAVDFRGHTLFITYPKKGNNPRNITGPQGSPIKPKENRHNKWGEALRYFSTRYVR